MGGYREKAHGQVRQKRDLGLSRWYVHSRFGFYWHGVHHRQRGSLRLNRHSHLQIWKTRTAQFLK